MTLFFGMIAPLLSSNPLIRGGERGESALQLVELEQVTAHVLRPAALTRARHEAAARERLQRQVQRGRATGLPVPSICASAASYSGGDNVAPA